MICTAVAVALHYIYLVVFFLMLAESIEIGVTVLYVFPGQSRLKWELPLAWGNTEISTERRTAYMINLMLYVILELNKSMLDRKTFCVNRRNVN